ncbi:amidohydrolase [Roseococcus sp. SDR]|uniref:amidohydrolase n=1 Tax=Roseococcus sp. SDR TaxID=2835532 RepID=UPI001BD183ED|nr:amidohydrolase [Roseococcus sp. SDR]MBS7792053.1 amidohydrolase [Roseococcus sp. SDR]MBV1847367.1 amidohydrolase [Roseococcus sp. SDR]
MNPDLQSKLTLWRRHLHANPGLTLDEGETAAFVVEKLRELGVTEIETGIGGHGVVATLRRAASGAGGNRSVGLRADMDALPIQELDETLPHRSRKPGVMHACGHDGHTTALLGAAALLLEDQAWSGTVRLVFQPAEEGGGGARHMIRDGLFQRFPMDRIFGWHNWPGLAAGHIAIHDKAVMAAGARFEIIFEGHAGHAALPHMTRDPMLGAGHAIVALQSIVARGVDPLESAVVSVTIAEAGSAGNQISSRARLHGTARWLDEAVGDLIETRMREIAHGIAAAFGLTASVEFRRGVPVTANHPAERETAAAAAASVTTARRDLPPAMTGEDFSWFLNEVPGAFVWIGNGPADGGRELHHPAYDFNDDVLPVASSYLAAVAKRALGED